MSSEKSMKTVGTGLKIRQPAKAFGIQKKPFNLEIPTAAQKFRGTAPLIAQQAHRLTRFGDSRKSSNIQSFVNVKRAMKPVAVSTVIIVKTVCQVAALLNFSKQNTGANFVNCSSGDEKEVVLMDRNMIETGLYGTAADRIPNL